MDGIHQPASPPPLRLVTRGGRDALLQKGLHQVFQRVARQGDLARNPALAEQQVVVHDPASRAFQRNQQPERRLLAEHSHQHYAAAVLLESVVFQRGLGKIVPQQGGVLFDGEYVAGSQEEIKLRGGIEPGSAAASFEELGDDAAVFIVRSEERRVGKECRL